MPKPQQSHRFTSPESEALSARLLASSSSLVRDNLAAIIADIEASALDQGPDSKTAVSVTTKLAIAYDPRSRTVTIDANLDWKREVKHSDSADTFVLDLNQQTLPGV